MVLPCAKHVLAGPRQTKQGVRLDMPFAHNHPESRRAVPPLQVVEQRVFGKEQLQAL
jgi:hypothetical protein